MSIRFGTDGVRGLAGKSPITYEGAERIGRSALQLARSLGGHQVVVCRDTRPTSADLEDGVVAGIVGDGGHAILGGVQPTSAVAMAIEKGLAAAGVMVTASHNPAEDNGFKVFGRAGRKLDDEATAQFEEWLTEQVEETTATGRLTDRKDQVHRLWASSVEATLGDLRGLSRMPLAVDLANGASTRCVDWLRMSVPAALTLVGAGEGVINERVGSEHPDALKDAMRAARCTAGIAVDGDGDRCLLVDEQFHSVSGDALAWLLATRMGAKHLVVTEMSNGALEASLPGVSVHRVPVGDRNLREAMDASGWPLGCEESGHVLFHDVPGGDGLITGLRALLLLKPGERLSEAVSPFKPMPRKLSKVRVDRRPPLEEVPEIEDAVQLARNLLGPGGRVFLRYSGTEPVLRILVEGKQSTVDTAAQRIAMAAAVALR